MQKQSYSDLKMTMKFIPVNEPVISLAAKSNVRKALRTGWLSSVGPFVSEFEQAFANYIGVKHGVAVTSGTAALHVALLALGIGPGDEVIVPAFTMAATWLAVLYVGAKPVFVDCDRQTFNLDTNLLESKISSRTKAIIPVHIFGEPVEMEPILQFAAKHGLMVIEDAAEAHGAEIRNQKCGSFATLGCFSFYANKLVTCGEGGMIVTDDDQLADSMRRFRDLHHSSKRFIHDGIGYNYRLTNVQAAIGLGELTNIDAYILRKKKMAEQYHRELDNIPGITFQLHSSNNQCIYWMMAILVDANKFGLSRDQLRERLSSGGIDSRDFFYPPTSQPVLKPFLTSNDNFPNTEYLANNGLYLPSGLAITEKQIQKVCHLIKAIYLTP